MPEKTIKNKLMYIFAFNKNKNLLFFKKLYFKVFSVIAEMNVIKVASRLEITLFSISIKAHLDTTFRQNYITDGKKCKRIK